MKSIRPMLKGLAVAASITLILLMPSPVLGAPDASGGDAVVTNQTCPITGDPIDPDQFVEVNGQRIYFCCAKCRHQYLRDPDKYAESVASVLSVSLGADTGDEPPSPSTGPAGDTGAIEAHDHGDSGHSDEHAHDHESEAEGGVLGWLGKFHPASVHFPIAMLLGALFAEGLYTMRKRPMFDASARFCLWFGALASIGTVILGWFFGGFHVSDGDWVMTAHRWVGTSVPVFALGALVLRELRPTNRSRSAYVLVLAIAAGLVAINGFLGGALIYGLDHYAF